MDTLLLQTGDKDLVKKNLPKESPLSGTVSIADLGLLKQSGF